MSIKCNIPFAVVKPFLHALDPENAHKLTIKSMKACLSPKYNTVESDALKVKLWGLDFNNPVGLAAGFDKNAEVITATLNIGFGFTEVGTVTPKPQAGNPSPRVFRNTKNQAIINRMGFPNDGIEVFKKNVKDFRKDKKAPTGLVGLNIGMNKEQTNPAEDYAALIQELGCLADYYTINVSSPNTPGLRNLQSRENLLPLINDIKSARKNYCDREHPPPILVKLAPDLELTQQKELAQAVLDANVNGLILTNTTLARPKFLPEKFREQKGGLSGKPLTDKSTGIIGNFYQFTKGKIPIIGVGGISSGADAYAKIKAGASLVQLYSALVFQGPALVNQINNDLITLLKQDGFKNISEAVGSAHRS